jgi:hypothetical protein
VEIPNEANRPAQSRDPFEIASDLGLAADARPPVAGSAGFCVAYSGHPDGDDGRTHFFWFDSQRLFIAFLAQHLIYFLFNTEDEDVAERQRSLGELLKPMGELSALPSNLNDIINAFLEDTTWSIPWAGNFSELPSNTEYLTSWQEEAEARIAYWGSSDEAHSETE